MHRILALGVAVALLGGCAATSSATPTAPPPSSAPIPSSLATQRPSPSLVAQATPRPSQPADLLAAVTHTMDDLKSTRLEAEIRTGGHPDWQTALDGAYWVATGDASVVRIDEATNRVIAQVPVSQPCYSLAAGFGAVWAPSCGSTELDRIDPRSNTITARIALAGIPGDGEGQLAVAGTSVWLFVDDRGSLAKVDPKTNRVVATFATGVPGVALVEANGSLWASVPDQDAVAEIGLDGRVTRTIAVSPGPRFIAAGEGAVWVLGQGAGDVTRIDPGTGAIGATIALAVPGEGGCIATGGGSVWVTMPRTPVSRIDAATNRVTERFVGEGGDCIGFSAGSVWLSNNALGTVSRLRP